eukprot:CAMPEP_0185607150 /NCGR_PEP_ID=MMETSP0436-20130131/5314_1 /TAXON_ID=626734 ORGANISM="Favella taraikaensis, Strain Fe Narragansett Bay" /NCGR_SAMPLE_ID=MMETSP0436 /ASSEMBLY_ACC=CAM_ASM_000390 /LENGTH=53 /DNA_ID=CAMNT_0028238993 /DNA_START=1072 /DNA_END=1233 /DNA_ORIENTATION=+
MLFRFMDAFLAKVGSQFMPTGGSDFAERVRQWMEELPQQAQLRQQYTTELDKT